MPERAVINVRLGENGLAWVNTLTENLRVPRAIVLRSALVVARRHEQELIRLIEESK